MQADLDIWEWHIDKEENNERLVKQIWGTKVHRRSIQKENIGTGEKNFRKLKR